MKSPPPEANNYLVGSPSRELPAQPGRPPPRPAADPGHSRSRTAIDALISMLDECTDGSSLLPSDASPPTEAGTRFEQAVAKVLEDQPALGSPEVPGEPRSEEDRVTASLIEEARQLIRLEAIASGTA